MSHLQVDMEKLHQFGSVTLAEVGIIGSEWREIKASVIRKTFTYRRRMFVTDPL
jgi:hypothetical protein